MADNAKVKAQNYLSLASLNYSRRLESGLLTDVLARDVNSSFQFLNILCKILSRRLREINLKIYQWRIMSGRF